MTSLIKRIYLNFESIENCSLKAKMVSICDWMQLSKKDKTNIHNNCNIQHDKNMGSVQQREWAKWGINILKDARK